MTNILVQHDCVVSMVYHIQWQTNDGVTLLNLYYQGFDSYIFLVG
jgi:hypothetical protein